MPVYGGDVQKAPAAGQGKGRHVGLATGLRWWQEGTGARAFVSMLLHRD